MDIRLNSAPEMTTSTFQTVSPTSASRQESSSLTPIVGVLLVTSDLRFTREITLLLSERSITVCRFPNLATLDFPLGNYEAACIIVDTDTPNVSATDTNKVLTERKMPPMIVIGSDWDARAAVCTMKAGACDVFAKPFHASLLLASISSALSDDRRARQRRMDIESLRNRYGLLTPREREVLPLVVGGLLNKQAASILGISEITQQIHRGQVMRKMQADSLADLVRMAMRLKLPYWNSSKRAQATADAPPANKGHEGSVANRPVRSSRTPTYAAGSY